MDGKGKNSADKMIGKRLRDCMELGLGKTGKGRVFVGELSGFVGPSASLIGSHRQGRKFIKENYVTDYIEYFTRVPCDLGKHAALKRFFWTYKTNYGHSDSQRLQKLIDDCLEDDPDRSAGPAPRRPTDVIRDDIEVMIQELVNAAGDNYRARIQRKADRAITALRLSPVDRRRPHLDAVLILQVEVASIHDGSNMYAVTAGSVARLREILSGLLDQFNLNGYAKGKTIDLSQNLAKALRDVMSVARNLTETMNISGDGLFAFGNLEGVIDEALDNDKVDPALLSHMADSFRAELKYAFSAGFRRLTNALGHHATSMPAGTIFTEGQGPEMVVLPRGRFTMGGSDAELERYGGDPEVNAWERPRHVVEITDRYAIGRYPVTFDEYKLFCDATGQSLPNDNGWSDGGLPVINVSMPAAAAYCEWLGGGAASVYRLPSEAEWEYACRAGADTAFAFGDALRLDQANFNANATHLAGPEDVIGRPRPVDHSQYRPNRFGLYQMHGNVWEWCMDDLLQTYVGHPGQQPQLLTDTRDVNRVKVTRGGSWNDPLRLLRSAKRMGIAPNVRQSNIGFRIVRRLG